MTAPTQFDDPDLISESVPTPIGRPDRPALLVSSTSWTPDEDLGTLFKALDLYDEKAKKVNAIGQRKLPKVMVIVTGKGPEKERYTKLVNEKQSESGQWEWVRCISMWLEPGDYPLLLGMSESHC